jgi:hypothetical protein
VLWLAGSRTTELSHKQPEYQTPIKGTETRADLSVSAERDTVGRVAQGGHSRHRHTQEDRKQSKIQNSYITSYFL